MSNIFLILDVGNVEKIRLDPNDIKKYHASVEEMGINAGRHSKNCTKIYCPDGIYIARCSVEQFDNALRELHFMIKEVG